MTSWMSSVSTVSRSQSSPGPAGPECGASPAPGWGSSPGRSRTSSTRITSSMFRSGEHSAVKKIFHIPSADFLKCGWTSTRNISMKELMILQSILEIFQRNVRSSLYFIIIFLFVSQSGCPDETADLKAEMMRFL